MFISQRHISESCLPNDNNGVNMHNRGNGTGALPGEDQLQPQGKIESIVGLRFRPRNSNPRVNSYSVKEAHRDSGIIR